jgi:hypothetical protein
MLRRFAHSLIFVLMIAVIMGCNLTTEAEGLPTGQATSTPAFTPTPAAPADAVVVDTLDQEVYPFIADGNCSLGEAIQTIVTQQVEDKCVLPAGSSTI